MASGRGTTEIDFGSISTPRTQASVTVSGQTGLLGNAASQVEAWVRFEATAEHSVDEIRVHGPRVGAALNGAESFIIYAEAFHLRDYGKYLIDWVWMQ